MRPRLSLAFGASLLAMLPTSPAAARAQESEQAAPGSGRDITRPLRRVDLRLEYEDATEESSTKFTLRHDNPVPIGDGWRINFRIDVPFQATNLPDTKHEGVGDPQGLGDILLQAILVRQLAENQGFGLGTQLIVPTAGAEALGKGKWRLRPSGGYRWSLPSISKESFFQILLRYDFSFAGDDERSDVRELQFAPNLEIGLPRDAYFSIFPSTDIRYNFVRDELFVPLNLEVGKEWGRLVTSLEAAKSVIKGDHPPYDWKVEGRVGLRF